ncbi:MAG: hypothetical protein FJ288_01320 [Planctomycetes bacterium]|nr:hypothetical protein [Planctomycetota bacterium]
MQNHRLTRRALLAASAGAAALGCARAGAASALRPEFRCEEQPDKGRIRFLEGDDPILTYNWGDQLAEGVPKDRTRACYCHPLWAPDGTVLTDDFPKDHYHHRGIFWSWPRMKARGQTVQTWHLDGIHQHHRKWLRRFAATDSGALDVVNEWRLDDGACVGQETIRMTFHRADEVGRAVDFELAFEAVGGPVELLGAEGKGYGGFCFRFAPRTAAVITTDAGVQKGDSDNLTPAWADLSARFGAAAAMAGAAIFLAPASPCKPTGWTLRYYGFLGPSWPGLKAWTLQPGAPATLRYRVYVHRGDAAQGKVAAAYAQYVASAAAEAGPPEKARRHAAQLRSSTPGYG